MREKICFNKHENYAKANIQNPRLLYRISRSAANTNSEIVTSDAIVVKA